MEEEAIGAAVGATDFSIWSLVLDADPVVKFVMIVLLIASLWSWIVIGDKLFGLGGLKKKSRQFEEAFWQGRAGDIDTRPGKSGASAAARVFAAASREWADARRLQYGPAEAGELVSRAERAMRAMVDREIGRASKGLGVLATIGSASPFIGLFGTVWGIMNAFMRIGSAGDTSIATVGGPIAEALFATGLGLVAAIPAVIFYNKFTSDTTQLADQLDTFSQDVLVQLSRRASEKGGS